MTIKEKLLKYIQNGRYKGLSEAARDLKCSAPSIWYALRALEQEGVITKQSTYKVN